MSALSTLIAKHCKDFDVTIVSSECTRVFIEITCLKTFNYHNMDVALGQEVEGLTMLIYEWELMKTNIELDDYLH